MNHAVVRTDLLSGTDVRSDLVSFKFFVENEDEELVATAIENGNIVKLNDLMEGEREIFEAVTPAATDKLSELVLVAGVEMMYDERLHNLDDYINEAGKAVRGYRLPHGKIFSVTEEAFANASPAVGQIVEVAASTKLNNVASATVGSTVIGRILDKEKAGRYTYYAILID